MRALIVADLHYSLPQFDWVVNEAQRFDLVVLAGDHLDLSSLVDGRAQSLVVQKYVELLRERTKVVICSGNHDLDSRDEFGEKTARWVSLCRHERVSCDGDTIAMGDMLLTACPWWDGPLARARIADQFAAAAERRGAHWIWVYHAPPDKSPTSWAGGRDGGDAALSAWIAQYRPDLVFCGHIHQSPFVKGGSWVDRIGETLVFNTGQHAGAPPPHIMLDTVRREAFWTSSAGAQLLRFDEPLVLPLPRLAEPPDWVIAAPASGPSLAQSPPPAG